MASYGIQVQMYIDDKPTGRVFNHSTTSSTVSALYPNVDKPDGPLIETKMLIGNEWTTVGYVGAATGIDASGNTTRGAVLKSVDGNSYVIATNAGVRMQQGNAGLWIADNAISYRIGGGSVTLLGYAVFS